MTKTITIDGDTGEIVGITTDTGYIHGYFNEYHAKAHATCDRRARQLDNEREWLELKSETIGCSDEEIEKFNQMSRDLFAVRQHLLRRRI